MQFEQKTKPKKKKEIKKRKMNQGNNSNNRNESKEIDEEEERIMYQLGKIKNNKCKTVEFDGQLEKQRQDKVLILIYSDKCEAFIFDEKTEELTEIEGVSLPTLHHCLVTIPNGNILLFYGVNTKTGYASSNIELFDSKNQTFSTIANTIEERIDASCVLLSSAIVFICGGRTRKWGYNSCEFFDPRTCVSSRSKARMKEDRISHTASLLPDGRVIICGGVSINKATIHRAALKTTEIYDPSSDSFSDGPLMTVGRVDHAETTLSDGRVFICGGVTQYDVMATEIYNYKTNSFNAGPRTLYERYGCFSVLLSNGKVLISDFKPAREDSDNGYGNSEIFDPQTNTISSFSKIIFTGPYCSPFASASCF